MAARTRLLLEGPIAPTLLRLAAPNIVVIVLQSAINTFDAFFVGRLGPEALAGVSLAFPMMMLMQTMSAGGMGGGVASAIARTLGAGRREDANGLVVHALVIALVMASIFTTGLLWGGPALYRAMGGRGGTLEAALAYSNIVFSGALAPWLLNTLASIVRGTGNMLLPAVLVVAGSLVHITLSPSLIFGWGPFPQLGIAGAGVAVVTSFSLNSLVLIGYLLSGRSLVKLSLHGIHLRRALFWEILRVGALGSLNTVTANMTVLLLTGLVGHFGTFALAGYGMGARLEYLQIPLVFGFGSALVAMVGTNVGAGRLARAEQVAWVGAGLAAAVTGSMGLLGALFPYAWIGLFSAEPQVLAAGATYLRIVGPTYGFFGLGLALYFASQGAGRLFWPFLAGFIRLLIAAGGGWIAINWFESGLPALFAALAVALVVYGTMVVIAVKAGAWR
ncbi:MAG: MATE family efflux transporter [Candidatus Tectomicrobia bacterium]|nr:MATE family efflux transporter [Candidatus Tectomicrobia bacterium]